MYLIAIGWFYVVLMMAVAEAISTQGTVLGAVITFLLYGMLPVALLMYIMGSPGRRRIRKTAEAAELAHLAQESDAESSAAPAGGGMAGMADQVSAASTSEATPSGSFAPDGGGVAPGASVAAVRKEA